MRQEFMRILQEESELEEIVRLVGVDALSWKDRLTLEVARSIREDYLHQNAFHEVDTYSPLEKQYLMMKLMLDYYEAASGALQKGAGIEGLVALPVRERIGRFKYIESDKIQQEYDAILQVLAEQIDAQIQASKEEF